MFHAGPGAFIYRQKHRVVDQHFDPWLGAETTIGVCQTIMSGRLVILLSWAFVALFAYLLGAKASNGTHERGR